MIKKNFKLLNKSGLHARPASKLCVMARGFHCEIQLEYDDQKIDVKRILDLMAANLKQGMLFQITCEGTDEIHAMDSIASFIENLDD